MNENETEKLDSVQNDAIETFGIESQIDECNRACAELIGALCMWKRYGDGYTEPTAYVTDICSRLAGVEIAIDQMKRIFDGEGDVSRSVGRWLSRLEIETGLRKNRGGRT